MVDRALFLAVLLLRPAVVAAVYRPGSAGAGYVSATWRLPSWTPTYAMAASTVFMPCNYSGFHNVSEAAAYGWVQYDWSDDKDEWVQGKPMDAEAVASQQAAKLRAVADASTVVGLYQSGPKALPWFPEVRAKLDDPQYEGWFLKFRNTSKTNVPVCTGDLCSDLYHDQTQVPQHDYDNGDDYDNGVCVDACDCGKTKPCGNYVWDFRNESFQAWYVETLFLARLEATPGARAFYIDDRIYGSGDDAYVSEMSTYFMDDVALEADERVALRIGFETTMEALYDGLVARGAFAWQMLDDGPHSEAAKTPDICAAILRKDYCADGGGLPATRATLETHAIDDWADADKAESYTAQFLLYRGPYAWLGYDWNGCRVDHYPYPPQWSEDFGAPVATCSEVADGVFQRNWTKATVTWDCHAARGTIDRGGGSA